MSFVAASSLGKWPLVHTASDVWADTAYHPRPQRGRARVRASERTDGPHRAHDRHSPRQGENRHGQSGLQLAPVRLAEDEIPSCMTERVSMRPQICADRNRGTGQIVPRLAQTSAALTTSRAKMRLLEVSNLPMSSQRARGFPKPPE